MPEASGQIIEQTSTRVVYETPHMRLREDGIRRPDGSAGIYSYVEKPDFALIIPVENDGFHLVEQYRYPVRMRCWEFPQGTLPGMAAADDPEKLAREELRQETGMTASVLRHLGHLHCAHGLVSQGFDVFVASGLTPGTPELELEELRQETGMTASVLRHLGHLHCAHGLVSQGFDVFVASGLTPGTPELELEEQDLRCRWFGRAEVERMILGGGITDDSTLAAYTLFLLAGKTTS